VALITDPDLLAQATEVTITTATKTIDLNIAGDLSTDGVTLKCLYSFLKEEWKNDAALIKFPFPMTPITDEQFEFINGWDLIDDDARNLVRTAGWAVRNTSGVATGMWSGVITLGSLPGTAQVYFAQDSATDAATTNIVLQGAVNQAVQVYSDPNADGNPADGFDFRSFLKLFVREWGDTYASSALTDIGVSALTYQAYRFPLTTIADPKIQEATEGDANLGDYLLVDVTWGAITRDIGPDLGLDFSILIDGANQSAEVIYTRIQYLLDQVADMDAGAGDHAGNVTSPLLTFVGDTLVTAPGVYIDNYNNTDINRITFVDDTGTPYTFPFTASLILNFGANLVADADAIYRVFFTNDDAPGANLGNDYGTASAILVEDASDVAMSAAVGGSAQIVRTFAYDSNVQRGAGSGASNAPITVVAIGLSTGQFVSATGTIERSVTNAVALVAALERNYANPA
jgi:hypothetical protein